MIAGRDVEREHPVGLVSRLTNRLGDLEERLRNDTQELGTTLANLDQAKAMVDKPFDQATRLVNLRRRQAKALRLQSALLEGNSGAGVAPSSDDATDLVRAVAHAFDSLTTREQEILRLAAWEQLSAAEGAAVL